MKSLVITEEQMKKLALLNEISLSDAKVKFYNNIPEEVFNEITSWDNTPGNNMTPLRNWLLSQYKNGNITGVNHNTYKDVCGKFNSLPSQTKNKLSVRFKDKAQNTFKDAEDVKIALEELSDNGENLTKSQQRDKETIIIYEDKKWIVLIPTTYAASYKWCQSIGAHWCTGAGKNGQYDGERMFKQYTNNPDRALVMFIDKTNKQNAYQIAQTIEGRITDCMDYYDNLCGIIDMYEDYIGIPDLENKVNRAVKNYIENLANTKYAKIIQLLRKLNKWDNVCDKWGVSGLVEFYDIMEENHIEVNTIPYGIPRGEVCRIDRKKYLFLYGGNDYSNLIYYGEIKDIIFYNGMNVGGFFIDFNNLLVHADIDSKTEEIVYNKPLSKQNIKTVDRLDSNTFSLELSENVNVPEKEKGLKLSEDNTVLLIHNGEIVGGTSFYTLIPLGNGKVITKIFNTEDLNDDRDIISNIYDCSQDKFLLEGDKYDLCIKGVNCVLCRHYDNPTSGTIFLPDYGLTNIIITIDGDRGYKRDWEKEMRHITALKINTDYLDKLKNDDVVDHGFVDFISQYEAQTLILDLRDLIKKAREILFYDVNGKIIAKMTFSNGRHQYEYGESLNESKKKSRKNKKAKKTPSIYDQMPGKSINSAVMSMAQGDCGMLGESKQYPGYADPQGTLIKMDKRNWTFNQDDSDAHSICYVNGKMVIGKPGTDHIAIMDDYDVDNKAISKCGRFWTKQKTILFWDSVQGKMSNGHNLGCNMTPSLMKKIIGDLSKISNEDFMSYDYIYQLDDEDPVTVVKVSEYIKGIKDDNEYIDVPTAAEYNSMENDPMYRMFVAEGRKKQWKNDNGEVVPKTCPKCGSKVGLYIKGKPVFLCSNEKCGKYFGVPPCNLHENTNPKSVDLSSFKPQKELNAKFWKDDKLDSQIRLKLLDIANDFYKSLDVNWVKPKDIIMTGSLANYNWNKQHSDIDLHIIMDFKQVDEKVDFVKHYFDSQKNLWNQKHEKLEIKGFPVEVYVQDINETAVQGGTYSLNKDKWINKPEKEEMSDKDLDKDYIRKQVAQYMDRIEEVEQNYKDCGEDSYKARKLSEKANKLFDEIKNQRRNGLKKDNKEMSNDNIVFKALRRLGYLDRLDKMRNLSYDKMNSLNENMNKDKQQTVYIMVGIPGSGKSTWIKNNLPEDIEVVSRDIIRGEMGLTSGVDEKFVGTKQQEQEVTERENAKIKSLCKSGKDFVIDDINTGKYRKSLIDLLRSYNLKIKVVRLNTDLDTCIKRREGQIPSDVMKRIHSNLIEPKEDEYDEIEIVNEIKHFYNKKGEIYTHGFSIMNPLTTANFKNPLMEGYYATYPISSVVKWLNSKYKDSIDVIPVDAQNGEYTIQIVCHNSPYTKKKIDKDMSLCGYYPGFVEDKEDNCIQIQYEKRHSSKINDIVQDEEYIYHMTESDKVDKILKTGLTPREGTTKMFRHPERIHFFLYEPDDEGLKDFIEQIREFEKRDYYEKQKNGELGEYPKKKKYTLLRIDTEKVKDKNFFYDMNMEDAVYTKENIPPQAISIERNI